MEWRGMESHVECNGHNKQNAHIMWTWLMRFSLGK